MFPRRARSLWRRSATPAAAALTALSVILAMGTTSPTAEDCGPTPYDCAVVHVERGEFESAIPLLVRLLERTPRDVRALNLLGIALTGAGRRDEANARFREALEIDAGFHPAIKNLAINEFGAGRLAEAEALFERVLARVPDDDVTHLHLAEIHVRGGRCGRALPHYEKSRARVFQNPTWMLHHAACLLEDGRGQDATAVLERLPEDDAVARFEAGVVLGRSEMAADAARFFGSARRNGYPDAYAAGYNETLMLIEAGHQDEAIRVAEELLAEKANRAELYNLVSRAYLGAGRIQEAYEALRAATRLEPTVEEHYLDLALICLDHDNYDLGLEIVDVGLHYRPESSALYLQRGVLLAMKGLVEAAEKEFERARTLAPESPVPYVALAMAWMQTGQAERAVGVLRERTDTNPVDARIPYIFGMALMRSGVDPAGPGGAEAAEAFETAVRLDPAFASARAELGKLLLRRGDLTAAIAQLETAVALDPTSAAPAYQLAQAYRRAGDTARAKDLLDRVSRLNVQERGDDPDHELRRTMLRIVREGTAAPDRRP